MLLISFLGISAQERFVLPADEGKEDQSFFAFRERLIAAAERRDAAFILSIIDPKIELSFGGDAGIADFKRIWKVTSRDSGFWDEFLPVIKNGGSFTRGGKSKIFYAPYTFNGFPEDLDAFEFQAIFGKDVNLRRRPDVDSPVVASLSYNVVRVDHENSVKKGDDYVWLKVETLGGKKGFVKAEFVRSPIDYRAGFEKKRGLWKMVVFIAGD
jgi:hypothetical protein